MVERRPVGFVEGFIVTIPSHREGQADGLSKLKGLRDALRREVWLRPQQGGEPLGKILAVEIKETLEGLGLWARLEIYDRAALKITAQGLKEWLHLRPLEPPDQPLASASDQKAPLTPPEVIPTPVAPRFFQPPLPLPMEAPLPEERLPSSHFRARSGARQLALDL